jgi:hypothetical protein
MLFQSLHLGGMFSLICLAAAPNVNAQYIAAPAAGAPTPNTAGDISAIPVSTLMSRLEITDSQ